MCTTFSVSRRICLLTLAVMMVFSASQAFAFGQIVPPCCSNFRSKEIHVIKKCYEQIPRRNCDHAFVIKNKKGQWCIKPDAAWLKKKIEMGKITCPPDLSF